MQKYLEGGVGLLSEIRELSQNQVKEMPVISNYSRSFVIGLLTYNSSIPHSPVEDIQEIACFIELSRFILHCYSDISPRNVDTDFWKPLMIWVAEADSESWNACVLVRPQWIGMVAKHHPKFIGICA